MYYGISFSPMPRCSLFGRFGQKHGWNHGIWIADNNRLIFLISGSASFRVNDTVYQLLAGDWLLIPCGSQYSAHTNNSCEYYFFHFEEPLERLTQIPAETAVIQKNYTLQPAERTSETVYLTDSIPSGDMMAEMMRISGEMHRLMLLSTAGERLLFDLYFGQILLHLSIRAAGMLPTAAPSLMNRAISHVQEKITQPLTLTDLSVQLQVSKSYLLRLFRRHLGMTVTAYINGVKLDYAAQLLHNSGMNVTQVADYLGYTDSRYFSRLFRNRFGVNPSQFARGR